MNTPRPRPTDAVGVMILLCAAAILFGYVLARIVF